MLRIDLSVLQPKFPDCITRTIKTLENKGLYLVIILLIYNMVL
ncbi:hypothetical protein J6TS1_28170 [Siminovitchia terrae]|uniref:Uncharacterized protein n=1 Tax=Siminovitchia terrae TaxID=1914933 RepID=A0ABQ4KY32_SIMTE|nr:hypothetical protein J6TS1_28170 [Siminovitchia terrae]